MRRSAYRSFFVSALSRCSPVFRPRFLGAGLMLALSSAANAGPPFLTDDPEPVALGHWEIYAPMIEASGVSRDFEGSAGIELNYGAAADLQLTLGLPVAFSRETHHWRSGRGDLEVSVKYRFYEDEAAQFQIAIFPGVSVPTGSHGFGGEKATGFLPVWAQKDFGPWSVFGGAGYAINPGAGNRDFWTGGLAVTRRFGDRLTVGLEAEWQGADTRDGHRSLSLGLGAIYALPGPFRLVASGGPTFEDHGNQTGYHGFLALGIDL
jgi:hypothetical protein